MTILPKKKPAKDKNEAENVDHSHLPQAGTGNDSRVNRRPVSPTRWGSPTPRDELRASHDPGGRYEEYNNIEGAGHNKRRHNRPSPHRTTRKHRHHQERHERHEPYQGHATSSHSTTTHRHEHLPSYHGGACASTSVESTEEGLNSGCNSEDEYMPPKHPENIEEVEGWFEKALREKKGLYIKTMGQDGACLFRALADQIYGDQDMHSTVRKNCVEYMMKNADFYSQYVTEDFTTYLNRKGMETCHGNHIEIQALCELYNRPIEVYQYSLEPINTFHGQYKTENAPVRLSYHRNAHYNSLVDPYKPTIGVGLGLPGLQPGLADKNLMKDAIQQSEEFHIEQTMFQDKLRETDWELTQETIEEQVARESYLQWLRDQEKRVKTTGAGRSASATCSSASGSQQGWGEGAYCLPSPEPRPSRSPRTRSGNNSTQNSPSRIEPPLEQLPSPKPPDLQVLLNGGRVSPRPPCSPTVMGDSGSANTNLEGATASFPETASIMNDLPPIMFGLSEWDEDDVIAQVIAQSQQEYIDNLKKKNVSDKDRQQNVAKDTS